MNINDKLYHLIDNHENYLWSKVKDVNFPAVRLGDVYNENILFIFDDVNHQCEIQRIVSRNDVNYSLSDLNYSAGIIELSNVSALVYEVLAWLNANPEIDPVLEYDLMQNSKRYIAENFDF